MYAHERTVCGGHAHVDMGEWPTFSNPAAQSYPLINIPMPGPGRQKQQKSKRAWVSLPLPFLYGLVKDDTQVHGLVWCARSLSSSVCLPVSPPARSSRAPLVWFSFRSPFFHANSRANFWLCI